MGKTIATYAYVATDVTPVATATDVLTLTGVTGKIIRLSKVTVAGTATAASIYDCYLVKRTTLNTGGTSTNPVATKCDSIDPTASGILSLYTANPTLGTGTNFDADKLYLPAGATPASAGTHREWIFGVDGSKEPVIRAGETWAFNFAGAAVPAGCSLYLSFEWTEEGTP